MNVAKDAPKRPALRYHGGKFRLAPWIISFFPEHQNYVEPCGGAASVLLQKPRSPLETYNDLDGNVVNFFRVLRDRPDELIRRIRLTPWARDEHTLCRNPSSDSLENARRFYVSAVMGFGRAPFDLTTAPRFETDRRSRYSLTSTQITSENTKHLYTVASRFIAVQIENRNYCDVIMMYDNDAALIYFDPPYIMGTRTGKGYAFEWTDIQHIEAATLLRQCQGYVIVSGYACPLYTELYEVHGWQRHDKVAQTIGRERVESVWLSPRTVEALNRPRQMKLGLEPHRKDYQDDVIR